MERDRFETLLADTLPWPQPEDAGDVPLDAPRVRSLRRQVLGGVGSRFDDPQGLPTPSPARDRKPLDKEVASGGAASVQQRLSATATTITAGPSSRVGGCG